MKVTQIENTQLTVAPTEDLGDSVCSNCKAPLNGAYCSQCGQSAESTIKYFWLVVLHLLDDIFSFDSRASRTLLPLITRPGFLTNEYIQGRRVHYVPPLRLYFFISIIFFITLKFFTAYENTNVINIRADENVVLQVTNYVSELERQRDSLLTEENQKQQLESEELILLKQNLDKFTLYKKDLTEENNRVQQAIAEELVLLELLIIDSGEPLNVNNQERYGHLTRQLAKVRIGEKVNLLSIGNRSDGTIHFPALSPEKNIILNDFAKRLEEKASQVVEGDSGPLLEEAIDKFPPLMFVLLPIFAALLKVMYFFTKRLYLEHLTVALHSHSFVFITILLLEIIDIIQGQMASNWQWLITSLDILSYGLFAWIPVYLFIMLKRVYKQGYILTALKYLVLGVLYTGLVSITAMIALVWGLTSL